MTTKSAEIRRLNSEGFTIAEIASKMGIRYQYAYNVLKGNSSPKRELLKSNIASKPFLDVPTLKRSGFFYADTWRVNELGFLIPSKQLPRDVGVYAFSKDDIIMYIGVATMGLTKRLYFYAKPGPSQKTSLRLNRTICTEIQSGATIDIYVAIPHDLEWNGLPVHGAAGLELGLIKAYTLPWNIRSN